LTYEYKITVRGYELDSYNHLNNAVYLNYTEQARWEILRINGLIDKFRSRKLFLVITETHIRYIREALLFDEVTIYTNIEHHAPYLIFKHGLYNQHHQKLARSTVKTLLIDEHKIAQDIPIELIKA
jgi:YbgC/YbaW family acyl-CoA thioester hydrolase